MSPVLADQVAVLRRGRFPNGGNRLGQSAAGGGEVSDVHPQPAGDGYGGGGREVLPESCGHHGWHTSQVVLSIHFLPLLAKWPKWTELPSGVTGTPHRPGFGHIGHLAIGWCGPTRG